jgi:hypothetical protein
MRMRTFSLAIPLAVAMASTSSYAEVKAIKGTFVGPGTYATAKGCEKLAAVNSGGDKNVGTVPETLTDDGFQTWEGDCTFTSFTEIEKDKKWNVLMHCSEGPDDGPEHDVFERLADGGLKVTVMANSTILQRCDAEKGK